MADPPDGTVGGGGSGAGGGGGVVAISWLGLGLAAALILVQGAVSFRCVLFSCVWQQQQSQLACIVTQLPFTQRSQLTPSLPPPLWQARSWPALAAAHSGCALRAAAVPPGVHPCPHIQLRAAVAGAGLCGVHGVGQCSGGHRAADTLLQGVCQHVREWRASQS